MGLEVGGGRELAFHCRRCGSCCFGRGGVRLEAGELEPAAREMGLAPTDFRRLYLAEGPPPWDIRTGPDGFCLFHRPDGLCRIQAAKPGICRRWPFLPGLLKWESVWLEAHQICPGLDGQGGWDAFKRAGSALGYHDL